MNLSEKYAVVIYGIFSLMVFIKGVHQAIIKKNPYGQTTFIFWMGIFVWGDAVVLGLFWFLISLVSYLLKDWYLFLLVISVYWTVRSLGETIYWLNHQFALKDNSNFYKGLMGYGFFKSNAILFVYQVFLQCITVVSIIATIYLANLWLLSQP